MIIKSLFNIIKNKDEEKNTTIKLPIEKNTNNKLKVTKNFCTTDPIDALDIQERTRNALLKVGHSRIGDLINWYLINSDSEYIKITDKKHIINLNDIRGMGRKGINEVYNNLIGQTIKNNHLNWSTKGENEEEKILNNIKIENDKNNEIKIDIYLNIMSLKLQERTTNALRKNGIIQIKDLLKEPIINILHAGKVQEIPFDKAFIKNLSEIKGLGKQGIKEIEQKLTKTNLIYKPSNNNNLNPIDELNKKIEEFINSFNEREKYIFNERSVFSNNGQQKTLEELGDELKITRERIRQINQTIEKKIEKFGISLKNDIIYENILNYLTNNYKEGYGTFNFNGYNKGKTNGTIMSFVISKVLEPEYTTIYLSSTGEPAETIIFFKKGLIVTDLFKKILKYLEKFYNEKRGISRHFYAEDFTNIIIKKCNITESNIYYKYGIIQYLKHVYGIDEKNGIIEFKKNKKSPNVCVAYYLYKQKEKPISIQELLTELPLEYPELEWNYGIISRCLYDCGKKNNEGMYVFNRSNFPTKIINIFKSEEEIEPKIEKSENGGYALERDYSNPKFYILTKKLSTGQYQSAFSRKIKMNDYLYGIYKGESNFDLIDFLTIFKNSLSKVEQDMLKYRLNFVNNHKKIGLNDFVEGGKFTFGVSLGRFQQIEARLYDTINSTIDRLLNTEIGKEIKNILINKEQIKEYKLLDFSEQMNDEINGNFLSYVYNRFLSQNGYICSYLSLNGETCPYLLVYQKNVLNKEVLTKIFDNIDKIYNSNKDQKYDKNILIPKILGTSSLLSEFLNNEGYLYCMQKYLGFKYKIFEYNGIYKFQKIQQQSSHLYHVSLNYSEDDYQRPIYTVDKPDINETNNEENYNEENNNKNNNYAPNSSILNNNNIDTPVTENKTQENDLPEKEEPRINISEIILTFLNNQKENKRDYTLDELIYNLHLNNYSKEEIQIELDKLVNDFKIMCTKNGEGIKLYGGF